MHAALDASAWRNVRSREARVTLSERPDLVQWVTIDAADRFRAREFLAAGCLDPDSAASDGHSDEASSERNRTRGLEFSELFWPERLSPSNCELSIEAALAVLRSLNLTASDRFLDLGCARGRLVLSAFLATPCACCAGVELSPTDHALASAARLRCLAAAAALDPCRLPLFRCSDLRAAPLRDFTVLYCAIRGDKSRPKVVHDLITTLLATEGGEAGSSARDKRAPTRLILAGFGVDVVGTCYEDRVSLTRAYALRDEITVAAAGGEEEDTAVAGALYGASGKEGPRVLLEYLIGS